MTREELDTLWFKAMREVPDDDFTRYRFAALVAEAERERMTVNSIHSCHPECDRPGCVAVRKAVEAEREACAKVCEDIEMRNTRQGPADCAVAIRARGSK